MPLKLGSSSGSARSGQFLLNNGSSVLSTGLQPGFFVCPFAGTITCITLIANTSGSVQLDVLKAPSGTIPTSSIVASDPPKLTSAQQSIDTTLTGWTTTVTAGDVFAISVTSVSGISFLSISLAITGS